MRAPIVSLPQPRRAISRTLLRNVVTWLAGWALLTSCHSPHPVHADQDSTADYEGIIVTAYRYRSGRWGLYAPTRQRGSLREIVPGGLFPRWAPDRSCFAFVRGGNLWLHLIQNGANKPSPAAAHACESSDDIAWYLDSQRLCTPLGCPRLEEPWYYRGLIVQKRESFGSHRPLMDLARYTGLEKVDQRTPAVSAEGRLAFSVYGALQGAGIVRSHIYVETDAGSGDYRRLTEWPDTRIESHPRWSSDGSKIAFDVLNLDDGRHDVYVHDTRSGELSPASAYLPPSVPDDLRETWLFGWQPKGDGLLIGYGMVRGTKTQQMGLAVVSGERFVEVCKLRAMGIITRDAAWSPDGRHVAYIWGEGAPGSTCLVDLALEIYSLEDAHRDLVYGPTINEVVRDEVYRADPLVPVAVEW